MIGLFIFWGPMDACLETEAVDSSLNLIHTVLIKRLDILEIFSGHLASEHIELSKQLDKKG